MATTSQCAQNFLAKNQTNQALLLAKCPTMKETLTLPRYLQEIYADSTVTYAGYKEECVHYHGLSSTDGNSQRAMKYNSTLLLSISHLGPEIYYDLPLHRVVKASLVCFIFG